MRLADVNVKHRRGHGMATVSAAKGHRWSPYLGIYSH